MKDIFPLAILPFLAVVIPREDYDFWDKQVDKWGIALISLLFFVALAVVSWKRERSREKRQNEREDLQQKERTDLLKEISKTNVELVRLQVKSQNSADRHAKSNEDLTRSIKDIARKMNCPALKYTPSENNHQGT